MSLPLQIEPCEFLQVGVAHALQLYFEALLELADAGLVAIACGVAALAVSLLQICRAITKLGAVLKRPEGSGFAAVSPFAMCGFPFGWVALFSIASYTKRILCEERSAVNTKRLAQ
jgi:hypothetical protein